MFRSASLWRHGVILVLPVSILYHKRYGNTLIGTLRKIYGQSFAAGHPET
jgi:hypothetical protein